MIPPSNHSKSTAPHADRLVAAAAALALSVWAAVQSGRTHPDEVYQFLEPANRAAFHFGFIAWEWSQGLRNWAIPGLLAGGMKAVDLLGWKTPMGRRIGASAVVAALAYPGLRGALAYARRRTSGAMESRLALALLCGWGLSLYYLGRTMGEPMGALLGLAGLEALDRPGERARGGLLAGLWLGLAVVVRYAFAVLAVAALLQELLRRRWRSALFCAAGGLAVALGLGALDWASWGEPFHSIVAYLRFNLGQAGAARQFGSEPTWYFLPVAALWLPWPLLWGARRLDLRRDRLLLPAGLYLAALSWTPHKEERFLLPVVVLAACALAPAAAEQAAAWWRGRGGRRAAAAVAIAAYAGWSGAVYARLPDLESDLFRATMAVGADGSMTGLIIVNESRWGCGGDFYLGRELDVRYTGPGYPGFFEAMRDLRINRAVLFRGVGEDALARYGFRRAGAVGKTRIMVR